ncbi:MAG TPA: hypothetical protein EYP23_06465 [Thermoplasmata archaeon]|nr:hypothetical protein [Thermoplasmata archaeon]
MPNSIPFSATIVHGPDPQQLHQHIIHTYPPTQYLHFIIKPEGSSIKIAQIHQLKNQISLTPTKPRLVWIQQAHLATIPAQNALLKTIEEPPQQTLFVLTTTTYQQLLPTIISRCLLQKLTPTNLTKNPELLQFIKQIITQPPGERLATLKTIPSQREVALDWTNSLLISLQQVLFQTQQPQTLQTLAKIIQPALDLKQHLAANVNVTLALEHFLLSLPKTKNSNPKP